MAALVQVEANGLLDSSMGGTAYTAPTTPAHSGLTAFGTVLSVGPVQRRNLLDSGRLMTSPYHGMETDRGRLMTPGYTGALRDSGRLMSPV